MTKHENSKSPIKNRWSETRIFETIASLTLLNEKYPSQANGLRWCLLSLDGPEGAKVHACAVAIAKEVAREGGVTGVFGINFTENGYAVALYTTEAVALDHFKHLGAAKAGDPEGWLLWGAEGVVERGQRPMQFPLLGAWNWGKDVSLPDAGVHDIQESDDLRGEEHDSEPTDRAAPTPSEDVAATSAKHLFWLATRGPAVTIYSIPTDEEKMRRATVHVGERPGERSFFLWDSGLLTNNYEYLFGFSSLSACHDLRRKLMDDDLSVARRAMRSALADLEVVRTRQIVRAREYRVQAGLSREAMIKMRREGRVRALVYNTVSQTGLRRKETTLLKIKNVDFIHGVIWLPQEVAKSSEEQYVRLNSDIARRLKAYLRTLKDTGPEAPLFPSTRSWDGKRAPKTAVPTIKTFNKDIDAAGLPKKDARDRVLDFHALRMTYVTLLRLAGVPLDMAKRLARHSDIRLTEDIYSDFELLGDAERQAAEMLVPERRRQRFVPEVR